MSVQSSSDCGLAVNTAFVNGKLDHCLKHVDISKPSQDILSFEGREEGCLIVVSVRIDIWKSGPCFSPSWSNSQPTSPWCLWVNKVLWVASSQLGLEKSRPLKKKKKSLGTFLVVQWLGILLPIQGLCVRSLVWETKTPHAMELLCPCTTTRDPMRCNKGSLHHS